MVAPWTRCSPSPRQAVKNLGTKIYQAPYMKYHISAISGASFVTMQRLRKVFPWLPSSVRKALVQALARSRLDYDNALLVAANDTLMFKLQTSGGAKYCCPLVCNLLAGSPSAPTLRALHWLLVMKYIVLKLCCLTHKSLMGRGPTYMTDKLHHYCPAWSLRSSDKAQLVVLRIHTSRSGGRSFSFPTPATQNQLPYFLRSSPDVPKFKKLVKTCLL